MDNYLSLLGRGLTPRKKFISLGRLYDEETSPSHPDGLRAIHVAKRNDHFFPLYWGDFKPELSNYLIV